MDVSEEIDEEGDFKKEVEYLLTQAEEHVQESLEVISKFEVTSILIPKPIMAVPTDHVIITGRNQPPEIAQMLESLTHMGTYTPPEKGVVMKSGKYMDHEDCCIAIGRRLDPEFLTIPHIHVVKSEENGTPMGACMGLDVFIDESNGSRYPEELTIRPSVPEPSPRQGGIPVTKALIEWLASKGSDDAGVQEAINLVSERDLFGRKKYGQCLMSQDGRDEVIDAMQELGDLFQYLYKAKLNRRSIDPIRKVLPCLLILIDSIKEPTPRSMTKRKKETAHIKDDK